MRQLVRFTSLVAAGLLLLAASTARSFACPFCSAPSQTLAEQVAQADGVCLVEWTGGTPANDQDPGKSTYEILQVVKTPKESVARGDRVTLARYRASKKGDLFLLMGTRSGKGNSIEWAARPKSPSRRSTTWRKPPRPKWPPRSGSCTSSSSSNFPTSSSPTTPTPSSPTLRTKTSPPSPAICRTRKSVSGSCVPKPPQPRLGLYGMMLGLCGDDADAKVLAEKISEKSADFRIGIDGMISGYLLLTGSNGLEHIDEWKFKDAKIPFSETYAAMMGLRFMWQYAGGRISNERLMQSMRILLARPELADLVIADLARWNDWSVQERLMQFYGKGDYNIPSIKRAIIRYMLTSTQAKPSAVDKPAHDISNQYVERGKKYLELLRKRDPKTVKEAERFFFVN